MSGFPKNREEGRRNMAKKSVLSIGMIFKNEARCLERCLKSLRPLRDAVPCELVMADTGSADGSREIAARYADILFDFPWIDDFSAARNAVMDRCSGEWYFSIDCDEWLDEDIGDLIEFLRDPAKRKAHTMGGIKVRNYVTEDLETQYSDLLGVRLLRMDTGLRYQGSIHEYWMTKGASVYGMDRVILHHDGYVGMDGEKGKAKCERNMALLRKELEAHPKDLLLLTQCVESSSGAEKADYLERAVRGVEEKWPGWERMGPPILRHDVGYAKEENLPDVDERAERARRLFSDSPFVTVDITYIQFSWHIDRKDSAGAIPYGEAYLKALAAYRKGGNISVETMSDTLAMVSEMQGYMTRALLADAYFDVKEYEKSRNMLRTLDGEKLNELCVRNCAGVMTNLHAQTNLDMSGPMAEFWEQIVRPIPSEARAMERQRGLAEVAVLLFSRRYREKEERAGYRHAWTMFLPLAGKCGWGSAAAILEETDPDRLTELLGSVEKWKACPIEALSHALRHGASFPLAEKPLNVEEMDTLAARMAQDPAELYGALNAAAGEDYAGSWQTLAWVRALALAAVQAFDWKDGAREGVALARTFAKAEGAFLTGCYAREVLREGNLRVLPPMHRFGWYCSQAFDALAGGDAAGYVRLLRAGLETNPAMKPMVEYLTENTPELWNTGAAPELLALAEKVKALLAAYPADDPAVAAVKASPAYQRVAYLIEDS